MMIAQAAKVEAKFAKEEQAANKKGKDVREQLAQEAYRLDQEYREMYRKEYLNLINATVIEELDLYTGMSPTALFLLYARHKKWTSVCAD
jgi:hypothetical protein